jgi:hypothetical protein
LNATTQRLSPAGKGGKNRRRGKNDSDDKRELIFKEDGELLPSGNVNASVCGGSISSVGRGSGVFGLPQGKRAACSKKALF